MAAVTEMLRADGGLTHGGRGRFVFLLMENATASWRKGEKGELKLGEKEKERK